ncbi:MAG: SUMF1/EgtB/PvdO family nonheme iron enzyme, partial [Deltaproteobacteria bacterium]|nr:SUMF1/EgtB/PvdO family nonheme iron enzyme [Deltaproteobacteria bacterium]
MSGGRAMRVFVSSTYLDNKGRRKVVEDAIIAAGHVPVGMERFAASSQPTVQQCQTLVEGCDWLVGIVAHRYGWVPDGEERSITEIEYDAAKAKGMPRLMFVLADDVDVNPKRDFDQGPGRGAKLAKLDKFKAKFGADQMPAPFRETTLGTRVTQALMQEASRMQAATTGPAVAVTSSTSVDSDKRSFESDLRIYYGKLEALHSELRLAGFETKVRVPITLDDLYVPLDAIVDRGAKRKQVFHSGKDACGHDSEVALATAFEVAGRTGQRGVVLLGDPGSGKTTHLKQVLLKIAREGAESIGLPAGTVPVFLPLRHLGQSKSLRSFMEAELADDDLGLPTGFGRRLDELGGLLFLLDGLDEVANADERRTVARWIEKARRARPDCYFLVSCRFSGYALDAQLDEGFFELHLRPMNSEQVETFVRNWYAIVERATAPSPELANTRANAGATDLLKTLQEPEMASQRVYTMTHNPLLLTTICLVHRDRGRLPDERVVLYDEAVSVLLERWRRVTKDLPVTFPAREARQVLQPVAAWMHEKPTRIRASTSELSVPVTEGLGLVGRAEVSADKFLKTIRDESGLLTGWGVDEYGFMHLGLQEYLAARGLRSRAFGDPTLVPRLASRFGEGWWQEVILLFLAEGDPPMFEPFMAELGKQEDFPQWCKSKLMGLCWNEAFGVSAAPFVALVKATTTDAAMGARQRAALELLAQRMPKSLEGLEPLLREHAVEAVRAFNEQWQRRAADRLTVVAPRGGVELVRIPGGTFLMGSPETEEGRRGNERPQHKVTLADFYLAPTPVTNAQYRRFLEAKPAAPKPEYWGDRKYNQDQQPVVGVSWDEATAYCEWAGLKLPTEAQWEYACRAGRATRYYSGNSEADLARVGWYDGNSEDRLHAVGELEPNDFGLCDMHGNLWEWCADALESYTTSARDGDGLRKEPVG